MYRFQTLLLSSVLVTGACVTDEALDQAANAAQQSKGSSGGGGGGGGDDGGGKSGACAGGAFSIVLQNGTVIPTSTATTIPAAQLGTSFLMKGTHIEFEVDTASFGVRNWTLTGAANPESLTGGRRMVIYSSKLPDHRGLTLTSDVTVELDEGDVNISRSGAGLRMTVTAKDCAQGGVFQMEPERSDATTTTFTHVLGPDVFFYDNPNWRNRQGETFQYDATTLLTITPRINFSSDLAAALVGRDSPQEATRIPTSCPNQIPNLDGTLAAVNHCGGRSDWSVKSGGRMGQVMGEDSIALEPPQPICTHKCQSRSQVKGRGLNVGFPSPVPAAYRFSPRG